ncbi:hypothetical protein GT347_17130 [Xylophilus rhododendri]|uniref:Uncharacterized protein n=1 Tax=Xylophilus rhododendri TaxID=2697032 RepID=A0A857J8J4_9BURK|nr:hypothetical protein [Xylophilus rhododendri]QHI99543.1 hypothetical protein GT347_17130 [Xylophilus rhododendri]
MPHEIQFGAADDGWQAISESLDAHCVHRLQQLPDGENCNIPHDIPELLELQQAGFHGRVLLEMLRHAWHSPNARLIPDARTLMLSLDQRRQDGCSDELEAARFDHTVRKALARQLDAVLPGFAARYLRTLQLAYVESAQEEEVLVRKLLRSESRCFEAAAVRAPLGRPVVDENSWRAAMATATGRLDLLPVLAFLRAQVGDDELSAAAHPRTRQLLRHPRQAGETDQMGEGARCLAACIAAFERMALGLEHFSRRDTMLFANAFDALLLPCDWQDAVATMPPARGMPSPIVEEPEDQEENTLTSPAGPTTVLIEEVQDTSAEPAAAALELQPLPLVPAAAGAAAAKLDDVAALLAGPDAALRQAIHRAMALYLNRFQGFGPQFEQAMATLPAEAFVDLLRSMRVYGGQDDRLASQQLLRRDLTNIAMRCAYADINRQILGCERSFHQTPQALATGSLEPGRPSSFEMRTGMVADGRLVPVRVLNLAAPALDSTLQPEMDLYVQQGRLRQDLYRRQIEALFDHLDQAVRRERPRRVVLTAVGTGAFLGRLNPQDREAARGIVATALVQSVVALRAQGIEAVFTDRSADGPVWLAVNQALEADGQPTVGWIGKLPGDWAQAGDLIVNGADQAAVAGNHAARDPSVDGAIGACTLVHPQHSLACLLFSLGRLRIENGQVALTLPD